MITLVKNDEGDWIGLYGHDGWLIDQGHSFHSSMLLELLGIEHTLITEVDLSDVGQLPDRLGEVAKLPGEKRVMLVRP